MALRLQAKERLSGRCRCYFGALSGKACQCSGGEIGPEGVAARESTASPLPRNLSRRFFCVLVTQGAFPPACAIRGNPPCASLQRRRRTTRRRQHNASLHCAHYYWLGALWLRRLYVGLWLRINGEALNCRGVTVSGTIVAWECCALVAAGRLERDYGCPSHVASQAGPPQP
jgi:hypothetical protein